MKKSNQKMQMSIGDDNYGVPSISKRAVNNVAEVMYNNILEGNSSAISTAEFFKFTSEVEKKLREMTDDNGNNDFIDLVREEIEKNSDDGSSLISKFGTKLSLMEASPRYDYSSCNDPIWNVLSEKISEIKKILSDREAFLRTIKAPMSMSSMIDPNTGEIYENVELYPPVKTSTSTFKVELLKD